MVDQFQSYSLGGRLNRRKSEGASEDQRSKLLAAPDSTLSCQPGRYGRRVSSFTSTSSPWFRRNSLLSAAMIANEDFSVYESPSYYSQQSSFSVISLKESQGFIFNQDLFASPYQQLRSLANERRYRASFSHPRRLREASARSGSQTAKAVDKEDNECNPAELRLNRIERRHTSHQGQRPSFFGHGTAEPAVESEDEYDDGETSNDDMGSAIDILTDEEVAVDEYDEEEDDNYESGYGVTSSNGRYKVLVTEIVVNEHDDSIFPVHNDT